MPQFNLFFGEIRFSLKFLGNKSCLSIHLTIGTTIPKIGFGNLSRTSTVLSVSFWTLFLTLSTFSLINSASLLYFESRLKICVLFIDFDGLKIKKDDYIGICNSKIVSSCRRKFDAVKELLKSAVTEEKEIITIIYGNDTNKKEVSELVKFIEKNYSNLEVDVIEGNQEVYSYILAIE